MNAYSGTTEIILRGHNVEHNGLHIYTYILSTAQKNNR